jgi:inositol transport system substrate-binding protein
MPDYFCAFFCLLGPSGNVHSLYRREGFQKVLLDARPDITVLDEQIGNWYKDEGMRYMEDWLQKYPQIDAVLSMNDTMALGAIEAAKAIGRDKDMTYYGVDGLADAVLSIADGDLTATCVQNAYAQAEAGMEIAKRVLNGEAENEVIVVPGELITKDNTAKWIEIHTANGQIK